MSTTQHPGKVWMADWVMYTQWHPAKSSLCSAPSGAVFSNLPSRHFTNTCHVFYIVRCDWLPSVCRCLGSVLLPLRIHIEESDTSVLSRADPYNISSLTRSPPKKLNSNFPTRTETHLRNELWRRQTMKNLIKTAVNIYEAETLIQTQTNAPTLRLSNAIISIQA